MTTYVRALASWIHAYLKLRYWAWRLHRETLRSLRIARKRAAILANLEHRMNKP